MYDDFMEGLKRPEVIVSQVTGFGLNAKSSQGLPEKSITLSQSSKAVTHEDRKLKNRASFRL